MTILLSCYQVNARPAGLLHDAHPSASLAKGRAMTRPRAADDFATIRRRLEQLRHERAEPPPAEPEMRRDGVAGEVERRRRERVEGLPPPWVPTIFFARRAG
jgi:hypothetical protein